MAVLLTCAIGLRRGCSMVALLAAEPNPTSGVGGHSTLRTGA